MEKKRNIKIMLIIILINFFLSIGNMYAQTNTIISGHVYDASTNLPLKGVTIEAKDIDGGPIALTNADGKYSIGISDQPQVRLNFSKKNYETVSDLIILNDKTLMHDVMLKPLIVSVDTTEFISNVKIKGKVYGLNQEDYKKYKIVIYVLTNKWYIHPDAVNTDGKGYASISSNGSWEIETVNRGYQSFKLAILLVEMSMYTPATVNGDSDNELLNAISNKTYKILSPAPKGI